MNYNLSSKSLFKLNKISYKLFDLKKKKVVQECNKCLHSQIQGDNDKKYWKSNIYLYNNVLM